MISPNPQLSVPPATPAILGCRLRPTRSSTGQAIRNGLGELCSFLGSWARDLRRSRDYGNLLEVEAAGQIAGEIRQAHAVAAASAHRAETCDREALRLLKAAQAPDSEGGVVVTLRESAPIARLINRSAEIDHDLGEQLAPQS